MILVMRTKSAAAVVENRHKIGEEVSEQLNIIPARVQVIQHVRPKYACRICENSVKTAAIPPQPIPGSIATPGLLAFIATSKYVDGLPLYRQEKFILARWALTSIGRPQPYGWFAAVTWYSR